MKCKNCFKANLKKVINLDPQPISSVFFKTKKYNLKKYPLDLHKCLNCDLIQFSKLPPLKEMYGTTYGYKTSLSPLMINHMRKKYISIKRRLRLNLNANILDIGSNDGTFLNFFSKNKKINLFGIDPSAKKFKNFYNKKINIIVNYFSKKNLFKNNKNLSDKTKFKIITSFAMFYDIENPNSFCKDINQLLETNGLWVSEFSYFPLLFLFLV